MSNPLMAAAGVAVVLAGGSAVAQQTPTDTAAPLALGVPAPDFALPAATRWGVLKDPLRLSDYRGKTVVLAFFFRARTPG